MKASQILGILREHELLVENQAVAEEAEYTGKICVDNREIAEDDIFVCIKGLKTDGHGFIPDARQKKAALLVCEDEFADKLPAIRVRDSRKATALLAKLYYHDPSSDFRLVGITGTNGKTTTSMLLFKALREIGMSAGWIGTLGYDINDRHFESERTTPDILELNRIFADMASQGVKYVVMEVSSHALALDRVYGIEFDYCLFTNLSREHLDFHHNMEEYSATKVKLFDRALSHQAIALINTDDSFGKRIHGDLKEKDAFVFSVGISEADFIIRTDQPNHFSSWEASRFTLQCREGAINIRSPLIGRFNIANLAMSAATLNLMGFEKRQIEQGLNSVQPIRGRFERVPNDKGIGVFIDYAHTPDALENVLRASRGLEHRNILCLFGAGGERDKGKRPLMLKAALQFADAVIISDDNPRGENPNNIIRDIVTGSELWLPWWIIRDRRKAIHAILRLAKPGDVVLICGKGHETYQEIAGVKHHFDDMEVAREFLASDTTRATESEDLILPVDRLMLELLFDREEEAKPGYQQPQIYHRISTDSRSIHPNSIFFALKGMNFDGHDYLGTVLQDSNNLAVGQFDFADNQNYLQVADTLKAMASLYRKYLLMFDVYKIALTGSTGKSSTKELLAQVFTADAPTLKTQANENNMIGLCKTIGRIDPEHRYAIFELGTNSFGEIAALSDVCAPDAGIIMNIGPSHLEFLEDENGVYKEKIALFNRPLDIRLFDADDPRFGNYADKGKSVGLSEEADFRIADIDCDDKSCSFILNSEAYQVPYPVPYFAKNASFAIAMGILKGIPTETIRRALAEPVRLDMRLQLSRHVNLLLLADCYNANPVSMQSAIEYWHRLEPEYAHIAILGDMLELGSSAEMYHDMVAAILSEQGFDQLITVGEMALRYHGQDAPESAKHYSKVEDLISSDFLKTFNKRAVILVKGSHSIHLEKILPHLIKGV